MEGWDNRKIRSGIYSEQGRKEHDRIFAKHSLECRSCGWTGNAKDAIKYFIDDDQYYCPKCDDTLVII